MFLVSKAKKLHGAWSKPSLVAHLYTTSGGWRSLPTTRSSAAPSTTLLAASTISAAPIASLPDVWSKVSWWKPALGQGPDRAILDEFLHAVGRKKGNSGKNAKKYNKLLANAQCKGKVEKVALKGRPGPKPWSAPKVVLRAVYTYL